MLVGACMSAGKSGKEQPANGASRRLVTMDQDHAHPINLGRTSFATVDASSVNGERAIDNAYYGVPNAFDDGEHWVDKINYTSWMPEVGGPSFIDVHFDLPVTVTEVSVDEASGGPFTARLSFADGSEEVLAGNPPQTAPSAPAANPSDPASVVAVSTPGPFAGSGHSAVITVAPVNPRSGATSVRVQFPAAGATEAVNEIRVMGYTSPGVEYEVRAPRVASNERNAKLAAGAALGEWKNSLFAGMTSDFAEQEDSYLITYTKGGKPVCRVSVSKATGRATLTPIAKLKLEK